MNLALELSQQLDDATLSSDERALLQCRIAGELETAGDYEAARQAMNGIWLRVGERPRLDGLERHVVGEILLRCGSLSGWIGSARQIDGAQEIAKDLLSESAAVFTDLGKSDKVAEANIALALCYWREGSFDEARVTLQGVLACLAEDQTELKMRALLNIAMVDGASTRLPDALQILMEAAPLLEGSDNHALKGSFHGGLAIVLKNLGAVEERDDFIDRALIEYAAASYHLEQAGHIRNWGRVENNLGSLFLERGKLQDAHEHLDHARRIFEDLKDNGIVAQVDETRARVFIAANNPEEAERFARKAVRTLETGGEQAVLAEGLTTLGKTLARLGRNDEALAMFDSAIDIAEQIGNSKCAGLAALTLLEELGPTLRAEHRLARYEYADRMLADAAPRQVLARLRVCARQSLTAKSSQVEAIQSPSFVFEAADTAALLRIAHRIASVQAPVLISGEIGTGKKELARLIHEWSGRVGPFVVLNCATNSEVDLEARLSGRPTEDVVRSSDSEFASVSNATGGTLLLEEIAKLSMADQSKLIRFIESEEIPSIGAPERHGPYVRIVATTSRDLKREVERGDFRDDLFYQLEAFNLVIPPLRERAADIRAIANHILKQECATSGKQLTFTPEALEVFDALPLRENAQELRSLIHQVVLTAPSGTSLTPDSIEAWAHMHSAGVGALWVGCSLEQEVLRFEGELIKRALESCRGSVTRAARLLGITHQGLAFILQGRHKNLLASRTPARPRRRSLMRPDQRKSKKRDPQDG